MYTNMADAEPKSAVEYLEQTLDLDNGTITKNTCVVETRDDLDRVSEGGVPGDMISFNDLVVLIVLYHGRIEGDIKSRRLLHPVIQSSDFPHIDNIANITLAPTGMVNIGSSVGELNTRANEIRIKLQDEIVKGFQLQIDEITRKTDEIIKPSTDLRSSSYRVCDYCIDFAYRASGRVAEVVSGLYGYTFQGMLRVCRSKLFPMSGGVLGYKRNRQALDPSSSSKRPATSLNFKISPNLCVVIFDNVRRSIREDDCITFPAVCGSVCLPDEFCTQAARNVDSRCRILNLIKGFGGQGLIPFVDKYLIYSSKKDQPLNMGVVKLIFSIDANGNVTIKRKDYSALDLMEKINYAVVQTPGNPEKVYWSSMKPCIDYCTRFDPGSDIELNHNNLTVLSFDLTCSSMSETISVPLELNNLVTQLRAALPGGGGVIKKNKSSRKRIRTRKIKNRSTNVKYLRNRRNVKKVKRKTKKVRRTHRK